MLYESEQIRKRILKLMHQENLSQSEFAKRIGKTQPQVSDILRAKVSVTVDVIDRIVEAFPNISSDWLVYGERIIKENGEDIPVLNYPSDTRPRLPKTFCEGHIEEWLERNRALCQEKKIITQFADYEFTLILKNDRMYPKYQRGDELAFRKSSIYEWGNDYLLDTAEGPKFKRVYEVEHDGNKYVRCVSYNKENYPDFEIPWEQVYEFYKCVGVIRVM